MEYFKYVSYFHKASLLARENQWSPQTYYDKFAKMAPQSSSFTEKHRAELLIADMERVWHDLGTPYYKLDHSSIELFRNVSLEIPYRYIVAPFPVFTIHFPNDSKLESEFGIVSSAIVGRPNDAFTLALDFAHSPKKRSVFNFNAPADELISDRLADCIRDSETKRAIDRDAVFFKLAISVCFLATSSDKMVAPDVLSKDLPKWLDAQRRCDIARQMRFEERAKRRGKFGFVVTGERELIHRECNVGDGSRDSRQLQRQHARSAHFRRLDSGKVVFVRQCIVRPDLPPREAA